MFVLRAGKVTKVLAGDRGRGLSAPSESPFTDLQIVPHQFSSWFGCKINLKMPLIPSNIAKLIW